MAFDYAAVKADAYATVQDFGAACAVTKTNTASANALQPWRSPQPTGFTVVMGVAVLVPPSSTQTLGASTELQDLVKRKVADAFIFVPTNSDDVSDFDLLTFGGVDWRIDHVERLDPAGTGPLLFFLGASR